MTQSDLQIVLVARDDATPALHDLFIALGGTEEEWREAIDAPMFAEAAEG